MASSNEYLQFVLELLRETRNITYKKMMGEFMLYKDGILFGGVYDNRFLIKNVPSLKEYNLQKKKSTILFVYEKVYFSLHYPHIRVIRQYAPPWYRPEPAGRRLPPVLVPTFPR